MLDATQGSPAFAVLHGTGVYDLIYFCVYVSMGEGNRHPCPQIVEKYTDVRPFTHDLSLRKTRNNYQQTIDVLFVPH